MFETTASVLMRIEHPLLAERGITLEVKRDDLIHSEVSGNKWRKLKYNFRALQEAGMQGILTFGGAYSNHLLATASACERAGVPAIGMVRGDELHAESNAVLRRCAELGMELQFLSRSAYRNRAEGAFLRELQCQHPAFWIVPEGGANAEGVRGCAEVMQEIFADRIVVAQGTTTTSCGLLLGSVESQMVTVVPVLKGFDSIGSMQELLPSVPTSLWERVEVLADYHTGGYAKRNEELDRFIQHWAPQLPLDHVYTAKAFYALWDQISQGRYGGEHLVFLHTGGYHVPL